MTKADVFTAVSTPKFRGQNSHLFRESSKKIYIKSSNPIAKNPAIWYNEKGWQSLSFCKEIYIPFFREEKNYG
jgi:hypothetical protein